MLRNQLSSIQWPLVLEDVGPFIIDQDDQGSFNKDHLLALLD
jgi:hypothetical protein